MKKKLGIFTILFIMAPAVFAFDFGKILSDAVERSVDTSVRSVERTITNEVEKALSSAMPQLTPQARKDDGQQVNLSKGITIFGFDGCPHCRNAYAFLKRNNIRYQLMDTSKDTKAARVAKQNNIRGVPVIFVSGERYAGFSEGGYTKLFQKHGVLKK